MMLWGSLIRPGHAVDLKSCSSPLGMESGMIPNTSLTASSSYAMSVGPYSARLKQEISGGAWCPKPQIEAGVREYLQVDLMQPHLITAIATQGRHNSGKGQEYTEEYTIEYWRPELDGWKQYSRWDDKAIFAANSDTTSIVEQQLTPLIHATKLRIIPHSLMRRTVCLRVEIYGCPDNSGIVSYSAPEPSNEKGDHVDKKYDGWKDSHGNIKGGLGGLTDGQIGDNFFFVDMGVTKGNSWIAWRNSSFLSGYMELIFEFRELRNVSQVDLYANNYYSRDVQIFSKAVLYFSVGGRFYNGEPVVHLEKSDRESQKARNVTVQIQGGRLAKFIKICLYFNSEWIMLSEVYIRSEPVNVTLAEETEQKPFDKLLEDSLHSGDMDRRSSASHSTNIIVIMLIILVSVLLLIFVPVVFIKKSNKYSSQSTASILRNTLNFNIKDIFMNFTPPEPPDTKPDSPQESRISQGRRAAAADMAPSVTHPEISSYSMAHQMGQPYEPRHRGFVSNLNRSYNSGFDHDQEPHFDYNLTVHGSLVTAVSPESHRGRTVITLAPNKYGYNPKNLPNILQDGIHFGGAREDYHRQRASKSREDETEIPMRFMTLGPMKGDFDDGDVSVFAVDPAKREMKGRHEMDADRRDRAFSLSDLKKIHGRHSGNLKDSGAITIWNISPGFKRSFPEVDVDIKAISMNDLHIILKIGSFGSQEISIYETSWYDSSSKIVQVKSVQMHKKDASFKEYLEELKYLGAMDHPSLSRLIGLVTTQSPPLAVFEYTHAGDLYQHLRKSNQPEQTRFPILLSFILQICSAMKYLEAREAVHKDLAARNVLLYPGNKVKVTDTAMCSPLYADHYYMQDDAKPLPIRWLSWECTLLKRYTCPGSVWSFAITAWEIFNLCQYFPFENLTVNEIVKLAEDYLLKKEIKEVHPRPALCPDDLYKIMLNCWERKSKFRPTFKEIYIFLKSKYIDLVPIDDHFYKA